jgi:hypothetical protein
MILCCGVNDSSVPAGHEDNNLVRAYGLSIFYGLSCMYLGVASFLFHASHAETWRCDSNVVNSFYCNVI